uniref:Uncharacterized protein n=1 Tax=Arundo donax TaxID=35708 RepID=A0A0A9GTM6_ARUDO
MKLDLELRHRSGVGGSVPAASFGPSYLDLLASVAPQDFTQQTSGAGYWNCIGHPGLQSNDSSSDIFFSDSYYHSSQPNAGGVMWIKSIVCLLLRHWPPLRRTLHPDIYLTKTMLLKVMTSNVQWIILVTKLILRLGNCRCRQLIRG